MREYKMRLNSIFDFLKNPEIYKFVTIGLFNGIIVLFLTGIFTSYLGIFYVASALISYQLSIISSFFMNDTIWLSRDDVLREVPVSQDKLRRKGFIEAKDSFYVYFVAVKGFSMRGSTSPLSYERDNIREIILNKRKIQLVEAMEQDLYKEAVKNNDFEIYE